MFTDEELRDAAHQIFDVTLEACKKGTDVQPGFWYTTSSDGISFVSFTPTIASFLNSGDGKDKLFALVRIWIEELEAVAVWFVTDTWQFEQDIGKPLTEAEYRSKVDRGFKRLVAEGYGTQPLLDLMLLGQEQAGDKRDHISTARMNSRSRRGFNLFGL